MVRSAFRMNALSCADYCTALARQPYGSTQRCDPRSGGACRHDRAVLRLRNRVIAEGDHYEDGHFSHHPNQPQGPRRPQPHCPPPNPQSQHQTRHHRLSTAVRKVCLRLQSRHRRSRQRQPPQAQATADRLTPVSRARRVPARVLFSRKCLGSFAVVLQ